MTPPWMASPVDDGFMANQKSPLNEVTKPASPLFLLTQHTCVPSRTEQWQEHIQYSRRSCGEWRIACRIFHRYCPSRVSPTEVAGRVRRWQEEGNSASKGGGNVTATTARLKKYGGRFCFRRVDGGGRQRQVGGVILPFYIWPVASGQKELRVFVIWVVVARAAYCMASGARGGGATRA